MITVKMKAAFSGKLNLMQLEMWQKMNFMSLVRKIVKLFVLKKQLCFAFIHAYH